MTPTGRFAAHERCEVEATVTLVDEWQLVELYHQRWAGDLRAVPQNALICTHR